ncbi:MAG: hypothetical protein ABIH48_02040 [Candidatus Falkowbacteria bacterium]
MSKKNKKRIWNNLLKILDEKDFGCQVLIRIPGSEKDYFLGMLDIVSKIKVCIYRLGMKEQGKEFDLKNEAEQIVRLPLSSGTMIVKRWEEKRIITVNIMSLEPLNEEQIFSCFSQIFEADFHDIKLRKAKFEIMEFEEGK